MERRAFLTSLIGGVAVAAAARTFPFRVFSFPSAISLAPAIGNQFISADHISREALKLLLQNLEFSKIFGAQNSDFMEDFEIGSSVKIRIPQRFVNATVQ